MTRLANKKGFRRFVKIDNASLTPAMIWADCLENPRRAYPPTKITSRETTKITCNETTSIIKNSDLFLNVVELRVQHDDFGRKR